MSEADLREGLRAAVDGEPPLDFDADALIRRAHGLRAARKRRRALVAVGVATVVLMAAVLTLPNVLLRDAVEVDALDQRLLNTTAPATNGQPTDGQPSVTLTPPSQVAPPWDSAAWKATTLTGYLTARFPEIVPGASNVRVELVDGRLTSPDGVVSGYVYFTDREGGTGIMVNLGPAAEVGTRESFCRGLTCVNHMTWPDGSVLEYGTAVGPVTRSLGGHSVGYYRPDGTAVQLAGYNTEPGRNDGPVRSVPLTRDQLIALATDPRLFKF
ncbi:hypothetical protein ABZ816_12835 [Actinosynnema sp. NPDC047251]|uniref:Putative membrane protein n=1 Tax=Saccharothrix espanaensis (strain ATCC 51144 / DSM 44229 / JCM 9112 / NBRC 15066 / NRRL 15764) TaxID=1179773 RepID=K0KD33_SACES|nr:hypothetical protein [Saccharothrix espanaensis]CCH35482.1 putative membrane protein [Saccharothrix espanaensis DSM 44229]